MRKKDSGQETPVRQPSATDGTTIMEEHADLLEMNHVVGLEKEGEEEESYEYVDTEGNAASETDAGGEDQVAVVLWPAGSDLQTDVGGYMAIRVGIQQALQNRDLATVLFEAFAGKVSGILSVVPQRVMRNCLFIVNLRELAQQNEVLLDGVGCWQQNNGGKTKFYTWDNGLKEAKSTDPEAADFTRRTYKNLNCKTYCRVVVLCKRLGLAALQYYFKEGEQIFEITRHGNNRPPRVRDLQAQQLAEGTKTASTGSKRKQDFDQNATDDLSVKNDNVDNPVSFHYIIDGDHASVSSQPETPLMLKRPRLTNGVELDVVDASAVLAFFQAHFDLERQDRMEERRFRQEQLDTSRRERAEELHAQRDELQLRRDELSLQKERWDVERQERELMFEIIKKKLLNS